jgi:hypothetical protein
MNANIYGGYRIIENDLLTIAGTPYEVSRPWKERLFTMPWRPLNKTKTIAPRIPDPDFYISETDRFIVGHPETMKKLKGAIEKSKNDNFSMRYPATFNSQNPYRMSGLFGASII